jgi:hypothetical protein
MGVGLTFLPFVAIVVNNYLVNKRNYFAYFFLFLGLLVAILSKGRWMMINAVVLFGMTLHYTKVRFGRILKIAFIILLALIGIYFILPLISVNVHKLIFERILEASKGGFTEGSSSSRILAFKIFFKLFPKDPLFGVGGQITDELLHELAGRSSQLHVGYLSLFYYYGIIGGLLYMSFVYYLTKSLYLHAKIHGYYAPLYSWIGFLLANLTLNYVIPFEAGILLVLLLDKYYLIVQKEKYLKLPEKSVPDISCVIN